MKLLSSCKHFAIILLCSSVAIFNFSFSYGQTDEAAVDNALSTLKDVKVIRKTVTYMPYSLQYQLEIRQPVDHNDTSKGFFYQQIQLLHRSFSKPMVIETEGYNGRAPKNELEQILGCNDLNVEFRYFNQSRPDPLDWQYCTFEQATADLHHINQVFHSLYHSKWISTGISRGGETTLIYRYFYPGDVDLSVPYVAPMPNDIEDKRIYAFLDTAGGPSCVQKIRNLQLFLLQHEKEAIQKISFPERQLHYTEVGGVGQAFEYAVLEYPFSFWQITTLKESDIPTDADLDHYMESLYKVFGNYIANFSDEQNAGYTTHYYMTWQTGYYKYDITPFKNYLHYFTKTNPTSAILPLDIPRHPYDPEFGKKINAWLAADGNNILYIYGGRDTWTACEADFTNKVNAKRFVIPGANHFYARIKNMSPAMQQEFGEALKSMTGLTADFTKLNQ
jgi:hypothetical protein